MSRNSGVPISARFFFARGRTSGFTSRPLRPYLLLEAFFLSSSKR